MDQNSKQKTLDNLTKAEIILVAVSENAGFDGMAAGLALYLSCLKLGKNTAVQAKNPSVDDAQRLYGVDKIGRIEGSKNLVIVVNDAVENVDKVTYSLEGTKLKIVVHPFPGAKNVNRHQISFEETSTKPNLVFAVGFQTQEELNQVIAHEQNLDPTIWIININKQDVGQLSAQVSANNSQAASICEVTAQIFQQLALPLDEDIAYNLYAGVAQATNYFSPSLASPLSFETASWLLKFGAGRASFAKGQSSQLSMPKPQMPPLEESDIAAGGQFQNPNPFDQPPIEQVERSKTLSPVEGPKATTQENWLKPPKVYRGSKSFDSEK
ncbi:MAG: hypothetical protein Q7S45_03070 [Candidatus Curtissbacteria bacterium]|nr:hypothetical protein [Candidatus Curtissbacteria bacterium]